MSTFEKKFKHAFVDGGATSGSNHYGIGWVLTNHKGKKPSSGSRRLSINNATSTIAEIYAAAAGLNATDKDSNVVVHSDCSIVCRTIAEHDFESRIKKARHNPTLRTAWEALQDAIHRHDDVAVHFMRASDHPLMRVAHSMSQEGATKAFSREHVLDNEHHRQRGGGFKDRYIVTELNMLAEYDVLANLWVPAR